MEFIKLPQNPIVRFSDKTCIIRSAQGKQYLYSAVDNNIYECQNSDADLSEIDKIFKDNVASYNYNPQTVSKKINQKIEHLILNVTEQCNLRCTYCAYSGIFIDERKHSNLSITEEIAYRAIDFYLAHSSNVPLKIISFYGGEPFLKFKLIRKIINKYNCDDILFSATTNGTIRHKNDTDFLSKVGMVLSISIDGSKKIHDLMRTSANGGKSWNKAMRFIQDLSEKYKDNFLNKIGLSITISDIRNISSIYDFFNSHPLLKKMAMTINFVDWSKTNKNIRYEIPSSKLRTFAEKYICHIIRNDSETDMFLTGLFDNGIGKIWQRSNMNSMHLWPAGLCTIGSKRLFVSSSGEFFPCERVGLDFKIGDIENGISISTANKIIEYYIKELSNQCKQCWVKRLCPICPSTARWKGKINKERTSILCKNVRNYIALLLSIYLSVNEIDNKMWFKYFRHHNQDSDINSLLKNTRRDKNGS